jgi:acyl-CoA thioester hydrolase
MKVKIYYHHTDCGQVVYYARYLEFLEEARTEYLAGRGIFIKDLVSQGILFVVGRQEIDYKSPAFYADTLAIDTKVTDISRVSMEFTHEIKNQHNRLIAQAKTILVCVDKRFKPKTIPEEIRKSLS